MGSTRPRPHPLSLRPSRARDGPSGPNLAAAWPAPPPPGRPAPRLRPIKRGGRARCPSCPGCCSPRAAALLQRRQPRAPPPPAGSRAGRRWTAETGRRPSCQPQVSACASSPRSPPFFPHPVEPLAPLAAGDLKHQGRRRPLCAPVRPVQGRR
jgi:hypothetical protein